MAVNWARICKILTPFPRVQKQWGPSRYPHVNFSLHLFKKKTKLKILIKGKSRMVHFNIVTSFLSKETIKQLYLFNVWERERQRDKERDMYIYTCFLSFCLDTLPPVYSPADGYYSFCIPFLHEPEFSFYIQCIKKNSFQHFIDQLHLCFSVIVIQKHYRIGVWKITFWFCNSLDLVVVMICSLNNPVSKFITPTILCISLNTENRYSVGGTISSTTSVKNVYVVIKTKTFPQFL